MTVYASKANLPEKITAKKFKENLSTQIVSENAEKEEEALALEETEREAPALEDGEAKTEESDEN